QQDLSAYTQTVNTYGYGSNHFFPITQTTTNSKGEVVISNMKYPGDYASLTGTDALTAGIKNLQDKNVLAPVIERYVQVQNSGGSNNRVVNATLTSYKNDRPLPDTVWTTELAAGSTSFSATSVSSGSIVKSSLYKPQILFRKYDSSGNIIEQQKI